MENKTKEVLAQLKNRQEHIKQLNAELETLALLLKMAFEEDIEGEAADAE